MTPRAVLLGLGLVIFTAAFAPYNDYALNNTFFIGSHFPVGITLMMFVLMLVVNPLLRWWRPAAALRTGELITIWAMCLVGAAFPTGGLLRQLIPWLIAPIYHLPQNPDWQPIIDLLPDRLYPTKDTGNDAVVTQFFLGAEHGQPVDVPWSAWARPLGIWALYYGPFYLGVLLLCILLSRQWIVHEKLQYPIASVMLEMVREAPPGRRFNALFGDRRLWTGALIVIGIHVVNGLHSYFPKVPQIPLSYDMRGIFTEGFWPNLLVYVKIGSVFFSMVGIAFLMASETSLSLWLVVVVYCTLYGIFRYNGIETFNVFRSQQYGAILAMGVFLMFLARVHLWRAFRASFLPSRGPVDTDYTGYRWIMWGLVLCVIACVVWLCAAGMSLPVAVGQLTILWLIYLVMARLVAESGLFYVSPRMWTEHLFPVLFPGAISTQSQTLVMATVFPAYNPGEALMPHAFNAMRMNHEASGPDETAAPRPPVRRSFFAAMMAAIVLSVLVAGVVSIAVYYREGAVRTNTFMTTFWMPVCFDSLVSHRDELPLGAGLGPQHMAVGAGLILLFGLCRMRFANWPFVPIALCISTSGALGLMWVSIMIGWFCKVSVMRTGGVDVYNRIRPFFLGLVVGEFLMAGAWMLVGAAVKYSGSTHPPYMVLPDLLNT